MTWLARIVGALFLLLAGTVSGVAGWTQQLASVEPERVLKIHPGEARALLSLAEKARLEQGYSSPTVAALGAALMRRAPLLDAPLVYAGFNLAEKGDVAAARGAFVFAIERQPRNVPALSWLAADAINERRFEVAADYLERLAVLNPDGLSLYSEALASMAADNQGAKILESRLAGGSKLAASALERLHATSDDMSLLLRLSTHSPDAEARLVQRLLAEKGVLPAFIAWLSLAPDGEAQFLSWPFDPVFIGSAAPPPFNWEIFDGAELLSQGGLHVSYLGLGDAGLTQQMMMLTPGRYTFSTEMDGEILESGGKFEWALQCYPSQRHLGSVTVSVLGSTLAEHRFAFSVPRDESCAGQRLILRGRPGEFPTRARGTVRRVTIQPASASARASE